MKAFWKYYFVDCILYFITKYRTWINIILSLFLVGFVIYWVYKTNHKNLDVWTLENWWNAWGDPVLGLSTFLVAIVIWILNRAKDWEERLSKKLTVAYVLSAEKEREIIRCENAFLAHEGDIRNWGQALGQQSIGKNKDHRLVYFDFSNKVKLEDPKILRNRKDFFKHYTATFYLKNLPKDELENGHDLNKGKFIWKAGEGKAQFVSEEEFPEPEKPSPA